MTGWRPGPAAGYSTKKPCSRARSFMPVPAAKSSGSWVQPCSITTSGSGLSARPGGTIELVVARQPGVGVRAADELAGAGPESAGPAGGWVRIDLEHAAIEHHARICIAAPEACPAGPRLAAPAHRGPRHAARAGSPRWLRSSGRLASVGWLCASGPAGCVHASFLGLEWRASAEISAGDWPARPSPPGWHAARPARPASRWWPAPARASRQARSSPGPSTRICSVCLAACSARRSSALKCCRPSTSILRATTCFTASAWVPSWLRMAVRMKSVRLL